MDLELDGRSALITGSTAGIGYAIAHGLAAEGEEEFFRVFRPTTLIGRFASAVEVANLAVYLCGAGASATSGAAMRVDGGVVNQIM